MEDSKSSDFLEKFYLNAGFATRAIHAGEHVGQPQSPSHTGAIYQTSTFVFGNASEAAAVFAGEQPGYAYTRLGNPTVKLLEAKINALEGKEVKLKNPELRVATLAFSSGMAAISSTLMAVCSQGDTLILGATHHATNGSSQRLSGPTAVECGRHFAVPWCHLLLRRPSRFACRRAPSVPYIPMPSLTLHI